MTDNPTSPNLSMREKLQFVADRLRAVEVKRSHAERDMNESMAELRSNIERQSSLQSELEVMVMASKFLQDLVERVSVSNIRKLESLVNNALEAIFTDQDFRFEIESAIRRNATTYTWSLYKDGVKGNINSFGGGAFAVISLMLKVISQIISKRYPLLVLDESLSFVSAEYLPQLSNFLKELSKQFNITIVLVTHQPAFADSADNVYRVTMDHRTSTSSVKLIRSSNQDTVN